MTGLSANDDESNVAQDFIFLARLWQIVGCILDGLLHCVGCLDPLHLLQWYSDPIVEYLSIMAR